MKITRTLDSAKVSTQPHEVRANPDQFKDDVGDTYQGIRIVRDPAIPLGEIHLIDGTHRMIMRYSDKASA